MSRGIYVRYQEVLDRFRDRGSPTGVKALAEALGVIRQAVHRWRDNGIPELQRYRINELLEDRAAGRPHRQEPQDCVRCGRVTVRPDDEGRCEKCAARA